MEKSINKSCGDKLGGNQNNINKLYPGMELLLELTQHPIYMGIKYEQMWAISPQFT